MRVRSITSWYVIFFSVSWHKHDLVYHKLKIFTLRQILLTELFYLANLGLPKHYQISSWSSIYSSHLPSLFAFSACINLLVATNVSLINLIRVFLHLSSTLYSLESLCDTWENGWRCKSEVCAREDDNKKWIFSSRIS